MITCAETYTVRHLQPHDRLPVDLWQNMDAYLNPHWVWVVADEYSKPVAALITAPAHGTVILLRVWADPSAPKLVLRKLIRQVAKECQRLGMIGWMTMLDISRPAELRLVKLAIKYGGAPVPFTGYVMGGKLEVVCPQH